MKTTTEDLTDLLEELGVVVTNDTDTRIHGLCPMHVERTGKPDRRPSWSMDRDLLVHHCFSCGYKGSLRNLVADVRDTSVLSATVWLRSFALEWLDKQLQVLRTRPARKEPQRAFEGPLEGFCDPPDNALRRRQLERFAVSHYGILWDPEDRAWILPIRQENGTLVGYQRKKRQRVLNHPPKLRKRETLFGIDRFEEGDTAVLVESPLDVVRLYGEGITGGLSSYGVHVSDVQMELLVDCARDIVLALDNDKDGRIQTAALVRKLWRRPVRLQVVNYDGVSAKDVGEMSSEEIQNRMRDDHLIWKTDYLAAL